MDGLCVQFCVVAKFLHTTGVESAVLELPLKGLLQYDCCTFSDWVTYVKLSSRLFVGSPSLWCTCHTNALLGGPRNVNATTRCTWKKLPNMHTLRYPKWAVPNVNLPLESRKRPSQLASQQLSVLPKWHAWPSDVRNVPFSNRRFRNLLLQCGLLAQAMATYMRATLAPNSRNKVRSEAWILKTKRLEPSR